MSCVRSSPRFDDWFIILDGYDENGYNYEKKKYWDEDDHVCSLTDKRIPFHFLTTKLNDSGSFSKQIPRSESQNLKCTIAHPYRRSDDLKFTILHK